MKDMIKVGISITTRNRRHIFNECYSELRRLAPKNSVIVVVDDASREPCSVATTRFEIQQGIAKSKNECIRLLLAAECTHLFLFDDDCWALSTESFYAYINSGLNHAALSFQHNSVGDMYSSDVYVKHKRANYWAYNRPNGCMMYITKEVANFIGYYDEEYGIWGCDHIDYSIRIHQGGFTPFLFVDVPDGIQYFHSLDYYGSVESSVPENIRIKSLKANYKLLMEKHGNLL